MQTTNRVLDDIAKVAGGAVSTLAGVKEEVEGAIRQRLEALLADADLVTREEFDAISAVARKAREEQERLEARVAELETKLTEVTTTAAKPATRKAASKKTGSATK